jgi:hypothetical protein
MSSSAASRSLPASLFASACGYHVDATGALVKSRKTFVGPACPRIALVELQVSGSMLASTLIVTPSERSAAQMSAAY